MSSLLLGFSLVGCVAPPTSATSQADGRLRYAPPIGSVTRYDFQTTVRLMAKDSVSNSLVVRGRLTLRVVARPSAGVVRIVAQASDQHVDETLLGRSVGILGGSYTFATNQPNLESVLDVTADGRVARRSNEPGNFPVPASLAVRWPIVFWLPQADLRTLDEKRSMEETAWLDDTNVKTVVTLGKMDRSTVEIVRYLELPDDETRPGAITTLSSTFARDGSGLVFARATIENFVAGLDTTWIRLADDGRPREPLRR